MNKTQKISDFEFENTAFNQSSKNLVHSTPDNSAVDLNKTRKADGDDLKNYKCLCTICTCGKHNCSKKTKNLSRPGNTYYNNDLNDVNRTTEYSKSFQEKNPDIRQKIIQKSCDDIISSGKKIALDSNYKQDFKPFSRNIYLHHEKAKGFPDNEILFKSDENKKFSQSSYAKDYSEKEIIPTKKIEKQGSPNNISPHKTSFQSSTSYNRSFSKPNRDDYNKQSPIKPSNGHIFDKNQEKIAEQSTYNTNFDKKCIF
ncbi:MAG: hypothetical protein MHPSP_002023 [Paramarteilia canceri]